MPCFEFQTCISIFVEMARIYVKNCIFEIEHDHVQVQLITDGNYWNHAILRTYIFYTFISYQSVFTQMKSLKKLLCSLSKPQLFT